MSVRKLTAKQERFVSEYLIDLNATAACKRAGYSAKTAHSCGPRLQANAGVASAIAHVKKGRAEATNIDSEWVLRQAVTLFQRCMQVVKPALRASRHSGVRWWEDPGKCRGIRFRMLHRRMAQPPSTAFRPRILRLVRGSRRVG